MNIKRTFIRTMFLKYFGQSYMSLSHIAVSHYCFKKCKCSCFSLLSLDVKAGVLSGIREQSEISGHWSQDVPEQLRGGSGAQRHY